jgi:amino acid transporter
VSDGDAEAPQLVRGLGLAPSVALNVANMVGIGPFITIPLFLQSMHGPQALIGWVVAAVLVLCDGLVWSELGAALPGSGGTYHFLREAFGRYRWGRLVPFLFIWQFFISGALELASGYLGSAGYLKFALPHLESALADWGLSHGVNLLAAGAALIVTLTLCRPIRAIGWLGVVLCAGTLVTILAVIVSGLAHFDASLLTLPPDAFEMNWAFWLGLGGAMRIAVYDYLGYYNICHLGDEVREPGRTIPRAVISAVLLVSALYLTMNLCIIAVVPWQEAMNSETIAADFMQRLFGQRVAVAFCGLILWTALAGLFAMTLGYSRIPYAAARQGDFFRPFAWLHPVHHYPAASLLLIGGLTAAFCFFSLEQVISAAVTVRILVQFIAQIVALHVIRTTRPDVALPFRMWAYPLPSLIAFAGWLYVLGTAGAWHIAGGVVVIISGTLAFALWRVCSRGGK